MSRWISVEERLPEEIGTYIIYEMVGGIGSIGWCFYNSNDEWCLENRKIQPTHWMPLPPPPGDTTKGMSDYLSRTGNCPDDGRVCPVFRQSPGWETPAESKKPIDPEKRDEKLEGWLI